MAASLLVPLDIEGLAITADALLTQSELARHQVEDRRAHYHFTVKANQKSLLNDLRHFFKQKKGSQMLVKRIEDMDGL